MQDSKEKFVSQKENFSEIMINKLCTEKVLEYLSPVKSIKSEIISKCRNYVLDSGEILRKMI